MVIDNHDWHELYAASSVARARAEQIKRGIGCSGPLGFHKPGAFSKMRDRCLACDKYIYEGADGFWTAIE